MAKPTTFTISSAMEARFWSKVDRAAGACWSWTGSRNRQGYGVFSAERRTLFASHVSLLLAGKQRPAGGLALHSCDNPVCVRPDHLRWGSQKENIADSLARGRHFSANGRRAGTNNPLAKLTDDDIRAIRADDRPQSAIAEQYGIGQDQVSRIRSRQRWAHVQ